MKKWNTVMNERTDKSDGDLFLRDAINYTLIVLSINRRSQATIANL